MRELYQQCLAAVEKTTPQHRVAEEIIDLDQLECQRRQILSYCGTTQPVLPVHKNVQHFHPSWTGLLISYADETFMVIGLNRTGQAIHLKDSKGELFETSSEVLMGLLDMNGKINHPPAIQEQWEP